MRDIEIEEVAFGHEVIKNLQKQPKTSENIYKH